jgi:two-component system, NarL family, nitrate/nitrite response regulator NarL
MRSHYAANDELTRLELEAIHLVAVGWSNKRIAKEVNVTTKAIEARLSSAFNKTGTSCRVELVVYMLQHKLISLDTAKITESY